MAHPTLAQPLWGKGSNEPMQTSGGPGTTTTMLPAGVRHPNRATGIGCSRCDTGSGTGAVVPPPVFRDSPPRASPPPPLFASSTAAPVVTSSAAATAAVAASATRTELPHPESLSGSLSKNSPANWGQTGSVSTCAVVARHDGSLVSSSCVACFAAVCLAACFIRGGLTAGACLVVIHRSFIIRRAVVWTPTVSRCSPLFEHHMFDLLPLLSG